MRIAFIAGAAVLSVALVVATFASDNQVQITTNGGETCVVSNGIPDHSVRSSGVHQARAITQNYCFPANPVKRNQSTDRAQVVGVLLNGIPIRPETAEFYDATAHRGFSRDRSSGWRLSALGNDDIFRLDENNGHSDRRGLYHYHAMPAALIPTGADTLIGYAADGHEIHYVGSKAQSSYRLKSGSRATSPGGTHDGTYEQDWEYVEGIGNLDECNGAMVNGTYFYFATDTYPYFQRCHFGDVNGDFVQQGPQRGGTPTRGVVERRPPPPGRG